MQRTELPERIVKRGPRVMLRPPRAEDEGDYIALTRRSRQFHAGWVSLAGSSAEFKAYLRRNDSESFAALLLVRREDRAILGAVNLSQIVGGGFQNAYLGYWIGVPYARQGYMREGLSLVLDHAFKSIRLHRLEANIQPGNTASRRLVKGLGFRLEGFSPKYLKIGGRWRDHERWAILREEWPGPRGR